MASPLISSPQGFAYGLTAITTIGEELDSQMDFSVLKLKAHERYHAHSSLECAYLLLTGDIHIRLGDKEYSGRRINFFDEAPIALHLAPNQPAHFHAHENSELVVISTDNDKPFENMFFHCGNLLENEHRGHGVLQDTAYRMVRTIFDKRNRPQANLVLGEVVTFPGRWSSYPPHHHLQPEIYHYRFTEPQGYGHAELGPDVYKVHNFDTIKILDQRDHAQVAAPGYGMFYVWAIKHLPDLPYGVPNFIEQHSWTKEKNANDRVWKSTSLL